MVSRFQKKEKKQLEKDLDDSLQGLPRHITFEDKESCSDNEIAAGDNG